MKEQLVNLKHYLNILMTILANYPRLGEDVSHNYEVTKHVANRILKHVRIAVNSVGLDNVPEDGKLMIVANHTCMVDILALLSLVERPIGFEAKEQLFEIPVFNSYLNGIRSISVNTFDSLPSNKDNDKIASVSREIGNTQRLIRNTLNDEHGLVVFPEGDNVLGDDLEKFLPGAFKAPKLTNSLIVPTYIHYEKQLLVKKDNNIPGLKDKMSGIPVFSSGEVTVAFDKGFIPSDEGLKKTVDISDYTKDRILSLKKGFNK